MRWPITFWSASIDRSGSPAERSAARPISYQCKIRINFLGHLRFKPSLQPQ